MKGRISVALAGNPNSGKTTVFNNLTGSRQHVGNWPGVTVEKKEGKLSYQGVEVTVVDLPGTYSLSAYSSDERIARDFLLQEVPDVVVVIIDASNLERNLYLFCHLLELGANVVLDLNMMDMVRNQGIEIDTSKLSRILDVPVEETVANKAEGMDELKAAIITAAQKKRTPTFKVDYGRIIEEGITELSEFLKDKALPGVCSLRWLAVKLLEADAEILEKIKALPQAEQIEKRTLECSARLEKRLGYDVETAIVERRYGLLEGLVRECTERRLGVE